MLKNKKKSMIIIGIIGFLIVFGIFAGIYDYNRVKKNMTPIFCVQIIDEKNLNKTCLGLGYKIQSELNAPSDQPFRWSAQTFGLWFTKKLKFEYNRGNRHFLEIKGTLGVNDSILYFIDEEDSKYYLYSLESVTINFDDETISLKKALEKDKITIDEIIRNLALYKTYEDGGSTLYKDNEIEYSNGIAILKCNTTDGNKDVYIGHTSMKYEESFCKQ